MTPLKSLPFRVNFAWILAGNSIYGACQWGMVVLTAKLGSPEMVGRLALGFAIATPVLMFFNLQLRSLQATDARREYSFADYLGLRLVTSSLAVAAIAAIGLLSGLRWETAMVTLIVGFARAVESLSDIFYGRLQQSEVMDRIAISMMLRGLASLLALGVAVAVTGSIVWGAASLAVVWVLTLVAYDLPVSRSWERPRWERQTMARLVRLALPLALTMLLISLNAYGPRYFVQRYLGERELGMFAAMAYLPLAGTSVVRAMGESAVARLAKHYAEYEDVAIPRLLWKLIAIAACLAAAGVALAALVGSQMLAFLYKAEYAAYSGVLVWIMVSEGLWYVASCFGYAATARRRLRRQPAALAAVILALLCSGVILTPRYRLRGVAMSMTAASITGMGTYCYLLLARTHN